ncbi:hypothetical protein NOGI109294_14015 [Nocardiopsis gilva]
MTKAPAPYNPGWSFHMDAATNAPRSRDTVYLFHGGSWLGYHTTEE